MGTSRNDRSPQTPPWKLALAVLGKKDVSPERQSREIWLAASADRGEKLVRDLSHNALAKACDLVAQGVSLREGIPAYEAAIRYESEGGLALEMGKRALTRCLAAGSSPTDFVGEIFSEAVSYYASRDLPSYVAAPNRVPSSTASIKLKGEFRKIAHDSVKAVGKPRYRGHRWRGYISQVLAALQGKSGS